MSNTNYLQIKPIAQLACSVCYAFGFFYTTILIIKINKIMNNQITMDLFSETVNSDFIHTKKWQEFHDNGQLWIDGEIALVKDEIKELYDYRTGFPEYYGKPVVRIGIWTKYFDNGQLAWQLNYCDGNYENRKKGTYQKFPSFQKDGTIIK